MDKSISNYRIVITREYLSGYECDDTGHTIGPYHERWYAFAAHAIDLTAFCFYKSSRWNRYLTAYDAYLALITDYWWLDFPYVTDIKIRRSLTDYNLPTLETS